MSPDEFLHTLPPEGLPHMDLFKDLLSANAITIAGATSFLAKRGVHEHNATAMVLAVLAWAINDLGCAALGQEGSSNDH